MTAPPLTPTTAALFAHRRAFKAFIAARVGNEADAEDLLQHGLAKAFRHAGELKDGEKVVAWFYRLLRNAIVDHVRSQAAARRRDEAWSADAAALAAAEPAAERELCRCFEPLLATLKPAHAELIRRVELHGESVSAAALALGLTANHASVALHRARAELRAKLEKFCGACAQAACLDCDCDAPPEPRRAASSQNHGRSQPHMQARDGSI